MLSSVGLDVMNSVNPELNWKSVTKGRRSRKSVARSLNSVIKVGNSTSPKKVEGFSGSDSEKFGEVVLGQPTSSKPENVPLKKRRHLLQSPSSHPWASCLPFQNSLSSPSCEDHEQLQYPSCSSGQRSSNWHLKGIERSAKVRYDEGFGNVFLCNVTESEYNDAGDFSGIELLAAAASMDDDADNADKKDLLLEDSLMSKSSDASKSAALSKVGLKNIESENSTMNMNVQGGNVDCSQDNKSVSASKSLCLNRENGTVLKVNRQHWDLNTLMDAWNDPHDVIAGDLKDANGNMFVGGNQKGSTDNVYMNAAGVRDESSYLNIEENKSTLVSKDLTCSEQPILEEHLQETPKSMCPNTAVDTAKACRKNPDDRNSVQVLGCDTDVKNSNEVTSSDVIVDRSVFTKLYSASGMLMSEEKTKTLSGAVTIILDEDCSSDISESDRSMAPDGVHKRSHDVDGHDKTSSKSVIYVQCNDTRYSSDTSEPPGDFTQDVKGVPVADSNKQNDGASAFGNTIADCLVYVEPAVLDTKHEDVNPCCEGSKTTIVEDTCKSCSDGAQFDDSTSSVGRFGCPIDSRLDSDVSQDNQVQMVDRDDLTGFQEGYDSPYEDGELRGSFLCSWEDNEMENECVDYESDGRNGDGSDAADYPGSEIVEAGSEGSLETRRSLSARISQEGQSNSGPIKHSLRKHFIKDDSNNNEIGGKGSNAGSGTTVEQCMEMVMEENGDGKRRQLVDRRDSFDAKVTHIDDYVPKTVRGKLQSCIEGRSSEDATDEKDAFFMQQRRSRHLGGVSSRPERDISPDRYIGRYRSFSHGERDGIRQGTSWCSRRHYASNYQGAEGRNRTWPRSKFGESVDQIDGVDFPGPRQTANFLSRGLHRPLIRRPSVDRDDHFGVGRRLPLTRGWSNYRSRAHYSQRAGRDFMGDFEPIPDDTGASAHMPHYLSRRERNFFPIAGRSARMTLPRRKSRSRSRSCSPRAWQSHNHRERILGTTRRSRSPEFRSEARIERERISFAKHTFTYDYGEGYISPTRGRFSPQRNSRWVDDRNFSDTHMRHRSSPVRVFRRSQRFDAAGSSGWLDSDEYFRTVSRPGRFSFMTNGGRECKLESNYDDRRRDDSSEMMHRVPHSNDAGNIRRLRHNATDNFERNLIKEDNVRVTDRRDVPQTQGERKDKRAFKI